LFSSYIFAIPEDIDFDTFPVHAGVGFMLLASPHITTGNYKCDINANVYIVPP
jgi:hypothetical protein